VKFDTFCIFFHEFGWSLFIVSGEKKRPEHLHALFSRVVEMNQHKNIYVMMKNQRICVGIFAPNTSVLAVIHIK